MKEILSTLLAVLTTLSSIGAPVENRYALREPDYQQLSAAPGVGTKLPEKSLEALYTFAEESTPLALSGQAKENAVYSPLSLWLAMAVLAQCAENNSQKQVLDVLHTQSVADLQTQVTQIWTGLYADDEISTLKFSNSVWLNSNFKNACVEDTLDILARQYYAGIYAVPMGTSEANQAVTDWTSQQTNRLIGGNGPVVDTKAETLALLVSTLYYKANWRKRFDSIFNQTDNFTSANGKNQKTEFMCQSQSDVILVREDYQAARLSLRGGGEMVFILPNEGVAPESILQKKDWLSSLDFSGGDVKSGRILWRVPKMDVSSDLNVLNILKNLGVSDLLDESKADMSALTTLTDKNPHVSGAKQMARVKTDENGVEAAGVTIIEVEIAMAPPDKERVYEMYMNRPFLFVIRSGNVPLFIGTVNHM